MKEPDLFLCGRGANPDDVGEYPALFYAAGNQWEGPFGNDAVKTVRTLLECGADVNARCDGDTVLSYVEEREGDYGNDEVLTILREAGAHR